MCILPEVRLIGIVDSSCVECFLSILYISFLVKSLNFSPLYRCVHTILVVTVLLHEAQLFVVCLFDHLNCLMWYS